MEGPSTSKWARLRLSFVQAICNQRIEAEAHVCVLLDWMLSIHTQTSMCLSLADEEAPVRWCGEDWVPTASLTECEHLKVCEPIRNDLSTLSGGGMRGADRLCLFPCGLCATKFVERNPNSQPSESGLEVA